MTRPESGQFDIRLKCNPDDDLATSAPRELLNPEPGPSFIRRIEEQLGLKLIARKGPVPVIVIDSISRRAEN